MVLSVESLDCTDSGELQERYLWRGQPAESGAEQRMIAERDDVAHLPEQRARMSMIVCPQWDELNARTALQEFLHMGVEPWLVKSVNAIHDRRRSVRSGRHLVHHSGDHHHTCVQRVLNAF